ncbi:hypothetical protein CHARACLAT_026893 [Characodon lateralis]|uniref:Uncharacterized protein n=1 Tax=Characodon lateralis TaxID=208331 RepID=A0ABU7DK88_9TELE|nr:hypothetical protein [Characodon lateralis]
MDPSEEKGSHYSREPKYLLSAEGKAARSQRSASLHSSSSLLYSACLKHSHTHCPRTYQFHQNQPDWAPENLLCSLEKEACRREDGQQSVSRAGHMLDNPPQQETSQTSQTVQHHIHAAIVHVLCLWISEEPQRWPRFNPFCSSVKSVLVLFFCRCPDNISTHLLRSSGTLHTE